MTFVNSARTLLTGTLLLAGRPAGYVIMFLGGIFGAAMPVLHMTGSRYPAIVQSGGGFFFVWTLFAVGTVGAFAAILAARALWRRPIPGTGVGERSNTLGAKT